MKAFLNLAIEDPPECASLRATFRSNSTNAEAISLAEALAGAGCGYEAAALLRGKKKLWSMLPWAEQAESCLAAVAWWRKDWRDFARARQQAEDELALELLGAHGSRLWDFPPLLAHLMIIARRRSDLDLQEHIAMRLAELCKRGVGGMNLDSFTYMAEADLIEVRARRGDPQGALEALMDLRPHQGNRMHYDLRLGEMQIMAGEHDAAMQTVARTMVEAEKRTDYGRDIRLNWVRQSEDLAPLRQREDWEDAVADPRAYLKKG